MSQTILITGANRGLGLEFARQYLMAGARVIAACREPDQALALHALADLGDLLVLPLEVTDWPQVAALADTLRGERIDVLVNNAGVYGGEAQALGEIDVELWQAVLAVNTIAPLKLVDAVLPLLAPGAIVAQITSLMGSIADNGSGGCYYYRSSKAALNMVNKSLAIDLAGRCLCVALHPGWVLTDMGGPNALIDAKTSVAGMRQVLAQLTPAQSGLFLKYDGRELPW